MSSNNNKLYTVGISGVGFLTDSYDLFIINIIIPMLRDIYDTTTVQESIVKLSCTFGTIFGELLFGVLGDYYGRSHVYGLELMIIIVSSLLSCLIIGPHVLLWLSFFRFFLGIGIGADYPLSAVVTSESCEKEERGRMMALVFSMQGLGIMLSSFVAFVLLLIYNDDGIDYVWRLCVFIGVLPALAALYYRTSMEETTKFKKEKQVFSFKEFYDYLKEWNNLKVLLGTSIAWFVLDVAFYGINLNASIVLDAIGYSKATGHEHLLNLARGNLIIALMGAVPGYFVAVYYIDSWGRVYIQKMGFLVIAVLFLAIYIFYSTLIDNTVLFIILFSLCQFFFNFGANVTTFVIPGEVFPTRYRSTCHGISAASGKIGALLSVVIFNSVMSLSKESGVQNVMLVYAVFSIIGYLVTFWIPETKGQELE